MGNYSNHKLSWRKCCQHRITQQAPRFIVKFTVRRFMLKIHENQWGTLIPSQFIYGNLQNSQRLGAQMLSASDSRESSKVQGEIQWARFHAQISSEFTKIQNCTSIRIWKPTKILSSLVAIAVSIGLHSKLTNPG